MDVEMDVEMAMQLSVDETNPCPPTWGRWHWAGLILGVALIGGAYLV